MSPFIYFSAVILLHGKITVVLLLFIDNAEQKPRANPQSHNVFYKRWVTNKNSITNIVPRLLSCLSAELNASSSHLICAEVKKAKTTEGR